MDSRTLSTEIPGRVRTGLGQGARFTSLPWARRQFLQLLGIEPFPGTLNLQVEAPFLSQWVGLNQQSGYRLVPETPADCGARCYPILVSVRGRGAITAAIVVPEVSGYAPDQVEVIAAIPLRQSLELADDDLVMLQTAPSRPVKAALFDVDGTLVDSIDGYRRAAELAARPFGWPVSIDAVRRALNFGEQFWHLVVPPEAHGDHDLIARLRRDTMAHWPAVLEDSVLVFPGIETMLRRLKAAGVRLGICTASQGESFLPLERSGLLPLFDEVVTARHVVRRKPDPEGILLCMQRMGLAAGDTVYVGDTVADIRASHAAGLYSVGVLTGAGDSALLSGAGAHRIIPDLQQLPELLLDDVPRLPD